MSITFLVMLLSAATPCDKEMAETCGKLEKNETEVTLVNWRKCIVDHIPSLSRKCQAVAKKFETQSAPAQDQVAKKVEPQSTPAKKTDPDDEKVKAMLAQAKIDLAVIESEPRSAATTRALKAMDEIEASPAYQARLKLLTSQSEAKTGLKQIWEASNAAFQEKDVYPEDLENWGAHLTSAHFFFGFEKQLTGKTISVGNKAVPLLPVLKKYCPECGVTKTGFKVIAIGNIDDDDTLEVWTIDQNKTLTQLMDDVKQ
jgi:hypothetical protein